MNRGSWSFLFAFFALFVFVFWAYKKFNRPCETEETEEDITDPAEESVDEQVEVVDSEEASTAAKQSGCRLILNTNSKILHTDANCRALRHIQEENRAILEHGDPDTLVALGYTVCGICAAELKK